MSENLGVPSRQATFFQYAWMLSIIIVALGLLIQFFQQSLYQHQSPFFDSVQYFDRVYEVVSIRQQHGLWAAIQNATMEPSTFCFPYLLSIPFSYFVGPTREIGVWIEIFYLAIFVFSIAEYLRRVVVCSSSQIMFGVLPVLMMTAIYRWNSGLSDLRVDLPSAFLYGSTACWWFVGRRQASHNQSNMWPFVAAGLCAAIACLTRSIAPVFFICGFVPILIFDLFRVRDKRKFIAQAGLTIGLAILLSAWFYAIQFNFIYYYYAVWNTDANAQVSLLRSLKHFVAAFKSVGFVFVAYVLVAYCFVRKHRSLDQRNSPDQNKNADAIRLLWLGLAPVLFLVAKRTDINPFVSLPGAVALVLTGIEWMVPRLNQIPKKSQLRIGAIASLFVVIGLIYGYQQHESRRFPTMKAHKELVHLIRNDAQKTGRTKVVYAVNLMAGVSTPGLKSVLQFHGDSWFINTTTVELEGIQFEASNQLMNPARANWNQLPGKNTDEKIVLLERFACLHIDYLVMLEKDSVSLAQQRYGHDLSMQFADEIIDAFIQSGNWDAISDRIEIDQGIFVRLHKNLSSVQSTKNHDRGKTRSLFR